MNRLPDSRTIEAAIARERDAWERREPVPATIRIRIDAGEPDPHRFLGLDEWGPDELPHTKTTTWRTRP